MRALPLIHALILCAVALPASAQAPAPPAPAQDAPARQPAPRDLARAQAHIAKAKSLAGEQWAPEAAYFCYAGARTNRVTDPIIEPSRLFDNVYVVGDDATVVYIVSTADGLVLIDSYYPERLESVLLPGMAKLGLDPARVKLVLVTHGHVDHWGGAGYFQEKYGARVAVSAADWDMIETAKPAGAALPKPPKRDLVLMDGQSITHGGVAFTPVMTPGHTPGSMGFMFPVMDGGKRHMAALFGSSILTTKRPTLEQLQQHVTGIERFGGLARQMGVDVELQNHPLFDRMWEKVAQLKTRPPNGPNPLIVGGASYAKFMGVMAECLKGVLAEKGAPTR